MRAPHALDPALFPGHTHPDHPAARPLHAPLLKTARAITAVWAASTLLLALALPDAGRAQTRPLFVDCRGTPTASPTIILRSGAFGTAADWGWVLDDLAAGGRVCAYDRAGLGRSPPDGSGVGVIDRAHDMERLLDQIGERGKVILIGHSNGALYAEAFARMHPDRVAGLVYINGVTTDARNDPRLIADLEAERRMADASVTAAKLGLAPVVAEKMVADSELPPAAAAAKRRALTCHACLVVARDEDRGMIPGLSEVAAIDGEAIRSIPTVVITNATDPHDPLAVAWRAAEEKSARRAKQGWVLEAPGASHVSPLSRDRDYIDAAVGWLRSLTRQ